MELKFKTAPLRSDPNLSKLLYAVYVTGSKLDPLMRIGVHCGEYQPKAQYRTSDRFALCCLMLCT